MRQRGRERKRVGKNCRTGEEIARKVWLVSKQLSGRWGIKEIRADFYSQDNKNQFTHIVVAALLVVVVAVFVVDLALSSQ